MKYFQNRIAESNLALPVTATFTFVVWLLSGLIAHGWWLQLILFSITTYLTVELSNSNALLRIRSRMVSCTFLSLSCALCFLFGSLTGIIVQLCFAAATIILFHTYQDNQTPGSFFYAFLFLGIGSLFFVKVFFLVPLIWLLMGTQLQSLGWRTWLASVMGFLTPYWLAMPYYLYRSNLSVVTSHFAGLGDFPFPPDYSPLTLGLVLPLVLMLVLMFMGIVHLSTHSFEDKIRIRQLYSYFTIMSLVLILLLILQPQHYDVVMCLLVFHASSIIAHYLTLTHSRPSNIIFILAMAGVFLITVYHFVSPQLMAWIG